MIDKEANKPDVDISHIIDDNIKAKLYETINSYVTEKKQEADIKMKLVLKDDEPVYQCARHLSPGEKEIVNTQINEWIEKGIVQPSTSEYASPVVLV